MAPGRQVSGALPIRMHNAGVPGYPQGVDWVIPWHMTIRLENVLKEVHLLQVEVPQPPTRALTWIRCNVAERSKKVVVLTIRYIFFRS